MTSKHNTAVAARQKEQPDERLYWTHSAVLWNASREDKAEAVAEAIRTLPVLTREEHQALSGLLLRAAAQAA